MTATLDIIVAPTDRASLYRAELDGRHVITARTPFFAAARALLAEGVPPGTQIQMRWAGRSTVSMISTVGEAAALTVIENETRGPRFAPYRPSPDARTPASYAAGDRQRPRATPEVVG